MQSIIWSTYSRRNGLEWSSSKRTEAPVRSKGMSRTCRGGVGGEQGVEGGGGDEGVGGKWVGGRGWG